MLRRYLFKEVAQPFALIVMTLCAIMTTSELSSVIDQIVAGRFESQALYKLIGFYIPMLLPDLIPAAYFIALLISLNRLSQDNERTILQVSGLSERWVTTNLLVFTALPIMLIMHLLTLIVAPTFHLKFEQYRVSQKNRPITELASPGQFLNFGEYGVLLARDSNSKTGQLQQITIIKNQNGQRTITNAQSAEITNTAQHQYFSLNNGHTVTINNQNKLSHAFHSMNIYIENEPVKFINNKLNSIPTKDLWLSKSNWYKSELSWRIFNPLIIPVLCIWAVGLTIFQPRKSKVGAIATGLGLFVVYNFIVRSFHALITAGTLPIYLDIGWVHVLAMLLGFLIFFWKKQ